MQKPTYSMAGGNMTSSTCSNVNAESAKTSKTQAVTLNLKREFGDQHGRPTSAPDDPLNNGVRSLRAAPSRCR